MILNIKKKSTYSVRTICKALNMPLSSYDHGTKTTETKLRDQELSIHIKTIFLQHYKRYGHRLIYYLLHQQGIICSKVRVRRLMKELSLKALQPKSFKPKTSHGKATKPPLTCSTAPSPPTQPYQVWAGDFTYLPRATGWFYLALVMDLYSRKTVGYSTSKT
jgi:putative transposase